METFKVIDETRAHTFFGGYGHASGDPSAPCSPSLQNLNTEGTEDLSALCVKFLLATEDAEPRTGWCRAETFLAREEIFAH